MAEWQGRRSKMGQKYYANGVTIRKPELMDEVIKQEKPPNTMIRSAKSPDPKGKSRMRMLDYTKSNRYGLQRT